MQILESIREKLEIIGMSNQQSLQKYPFNERNVTCLLLHGINIVCNLGFLIYGTKDLMEFTDSLFLTITAILTAAIFINLMWKMRELFEFINNLEDIVDQSEWHLHNDTKHNFNSDDFASFLHFC